MTVRTTSSGRGLIVAKKLKTGGVTLEIAQFTWHEPGLLQPNAPEFHIALLLWSDISRSKIWWCRPDSPVTLPSGRISLIVPDTPWLIRHDRGTAHYLVCRIERDHFERVTGFAWPDEWTRDALRAESPLARTIMDRLATEMALPGPCHEVFVQSLVTSLILEITRTAEAIAAPRQDRQVGGRELEKILDLIEAPGAEPLNAKLLARQVGASSRQLRQAFKRQAGCSLHSHIAEARIRRAQALLLDTDKSLKVVAAEAGFSSPSYFAASFRQSVGCRPSEFRAAGRVTGAPRRGRAG